MKEPISIYIHIPFCIKKCLYCDFTSFERSEMKIDDYVNALLDEIKSFNFNQYEIKSIFFGGGTPTLLEVNHIRKIMNELNCHSFSDDIEITMESNPETLSYEYLKDIFNLGINRLSIGLQSSYDDVLKKIGRVHTYEKFLNSYNDAKKVGFNNINIDLMFSLPDLTSDMFENTLKDIVSLNPTHLSVYSLIVEENTPFDDMLYNNEINLPTDEEDRKMYSMAEQVLNRFGYDKYEISNYSKKGFECIHNMGYWTLRQYIGFGVSAHSFVNYQRFENGKNLDEYINKENLKQNVIEVTKKDLMEEFMFLGLRTTEGISIKDFKSKFDCDIFDIYNDVLLNLKNVNKIIIDNDNIKLTKEAFNISNEVLSNFLL